MINVYLAAVRPPAPPPPAHVHAPVVVSQDGAMVASSAVSRDPPQFSHCFTDRPGAARLPPVRPRGYLSSAGASPISHARHHGFSRRLPPHHRARLPQFSRGFTVQPRRDTQFGQRLERYRPEAPSSVRDTTGTASRHPDRPKARAVPPGGTLLSQRHDRYRLAGPTSVQPKLHRSTCSDAPRSELAASPSKLPPFCRSLHYGSRLGVAVRIC